MSKKQYKQDEEDHIVYKEKSSGINGKDILWIIIIFMLFFYFTNGLHDIKNKVQSVEDNLFGVDQSQDLGDGLKLIPLQTPVPAFMKLPTHGLSAPEVCSQDRLLLFEENEHRNPNQIEINQIKYSCLKADWSWSFAHFEK